MIVVIIWWFVSARKWFKGPKVNIEHMMLGRQDAVVQGQGLPSDPGNDSVSSETNVPAKILES